MIVGANSDNYGADDAGMAYLMKIASCWIYRTIRNPSPGVNDAFGSAVAAMGSKVVVGAPVDDFVETDAGVVYVYPEWVNSARGWNRYE